MSKLRIALVQFAPQLGRVDDNVKKATSLCSSIQPNSVDIVCLPEMALTGYAFKDAAAIKPFLEKPKTGVTSRFCADLSKRLNCYVVAGYPEVLAEHEKGARNEDGVELVGANSAVLYGPSGEWIGGYRKTNLFVTDKTWAKAGDGFKSFKLPPPINTLSIAICMDLNPFPPREWTLSNGPYELASYCLEESKTGKERTNVLVLLNAWLDSQSQPNERWDLATLGYWQARLQPLWEEDNSHLGETIVAICNRTGQDDETVFAGTSAVFRLSSEKEEIVGLLGRKDEKAVVVVVVCD